MNKVYSFDLSPISPLFSKDWLQIIMVGIPLQSKNVLKMPRFRSILTRVMLVKGISTSPTEEFWSRWVCVSVKERGKAFAKGVKEYCTYLFMQKFSIVTKS